MKAALLAALVAAQVGPSKALTLGEALQSARARNLDIKAAEAQLDQARQLSGRVWANYLPQLTASGSYTHNNVAAEISLPTGFFIRDVGHPTSPPFNPGQPPSPQNPPGAPTSDVLFPSGFTTATIQKEEQLGAQVQLSQALLAPSLWPAIQNAYLAEHVAELTVDNARREILFSVAQLYYGAVGLQQAVDVNQRLLQLTRTHERDAQVRYQAGSSPRVALLRAQIDRARSEEDLKRAQNAYQGAKVALAAMLDRQPDFEVEVPPAPAAPPPEDVEEQALRNRPDLQAAWSSVAIAARNRSTHWLGYLPTLGLLGQYRLANAKGFTGRYDSWSIGLGLSWVLFDGGLREVIASEDAAKLAEVEATRRSLEGRARAELERARLDLESARANAQKAQEQVSLARENMELTQVNYAAGAATYLEVTDAQTALGNAELNLVAEGLNARLAALALAKAAGLFNPG